MSDARTPSYPRLDGRACTLVLSVTGEVASVLYWGPKLSAATTGEDLALMGARDEAPCSPAIEAPVALTPLAGQGFPGRPGLIARRDGRDWATFTAIESVEVGEGVITVRSHDAAHGIALEHRLALAPDGDVLIGETAVTNAGQAELVVDALAAPVIPLPGFVDRLIGFEGRWSGEFQTRAMDRVIGTWMRENRRGRTSHDAFPGIIAHDRGTSEQRGLAYGFHLGWSGNHRLSVETLSDGRGHVAMEALLLPGEIRLAPGETYRTPKVYAAVSDAGLTGLSQAFHAHVRARPEHARLRAKPRPVHYNTWEAVYFDHDPAVLMDLADKAAAVGVERYVLDDGWFPGRRHDRAGLGDWTVDCSVYPDGLGPLIERVRSLGMEFGLWFEPEMANPDSDLARAHPDWILGTPPAPQVPFRHQVVLDFGRAEVRDHMFARIDALLSEYPVAYIKWDMNRDISQPGGIDGRGAANGHVLGLYDVLDRLRAAHPGVEIESCSSGGGRADYGVLERTDRVWTSDSNDALDRLTIQRGFSFWLPAELMGSHVGPTECHITGRRLSMATRVATALFGHMGMEVDLRGLSPEETRELSAGVALHKTHRALIHSGDLVRLDTAEGVIAFAIVAADRAEALVSYTQVDEQRGYFPEPLRLAGLEAMARYRVQAIWPERPRGNSVLMAALEQGVTFTGEALMRAGLQPPRMHPETTLVLHLVREG